MLYVANNTRYAVSTPTTAHITFNRSPQYAYGVPFKLQNTFCKLHRDEVISIHVIY